MKNNKLILWGSIIVGVIIVMGLFSFFTPKTADPVVNETVASTPSDKLDCSDLINYNKCYPNAHEK